MSIDTYSICPCGSGKKIKFCKCKDSVHELERILKMVEGGQLVPALDRLAAILDEHPDAAWALAIRGRLLLDLRELSLLEENAQRFRRLQPSNPLALTQSAASKLYGQDLAGATELVLEALTESGQTVDAFVLDIVSLLAYALAGSGVPLTARTYALLAIVSDGYEDQSLATTVIRELNGDPRVNLLVKSMPGLIPRPADADWGERCDEAVSLLTNNKIVLAETKFESLQRTAPLQPAILSGLLHCAIWRGDHQRQAEVLVKLSQCEDLSFDQRATFLAMSCLVGPEHGPVSVPRLKLTGEFTSIDEPHMALSASGRFSALDAPTVSRMKTEDGVVPKAAYQVLDREEPESGTALTAENAPVAIALALVFGRQTDREPRIEIIGLPQSNEADVRGVLDVAIPGGQWSSETEGSLSLADLADLPFVAKRPAEMSFDEVENIMSESRQRVSLDCLLHTAVPLLGGKTLTEAAGDENQKLAVEALLRMVEGNDAIVGRQEELPTRVRESISWQPVPVVTPTTEDELEQIPTDQLNRIDPSALDADGLVYLIQRADQVGGAPVGRKAAQRLLEFDVADLKGGAKVKLFAFSILLRRAKNSGDALKTIQEAKQFAVENQLSDAALMLTEASLRVQRQEGEAFQACVQQIMAKYGRDPEVMQQLQEMLVGLGFLQPDGSPRQSRPATSPAAAEESSGLWTPDGGTSAAATAGDGGGSKLWVPGMD